MCVYIYIYIYTYVHISQLSDQAATHAPRWAAAARDGAAAAAIAVRKRGIILQGR